MEHTVLAAKRENYWVGRVEAVTDQVLGTLEKYQAEEDRYVSKAYTVSFYLDHEEFNCVINNDFDWGFVCYSGKAPEKESLAKRYYGILLTSLVDRLGEYGFIVEKDVVDENEIDIYSMCKNEKDLKVLLAMRIDL